MNQQKGQGAIFVIVGILAVIVIAGAFYLGRSTTSKSSPAQVITPQTPQATSNPSSSDETANWEIYKSTKYNYSIRYPVNLSIDSSSSSIQPKPDIILNFPKDPNRDYYYFTINISVMDIPTNLSLKQATDQVASKYYSIKGIEFQQIKVAGIDALASEFPQAYYGYVAFLLKENKLYAFKLSGNPGNSTPTEEKKIFDQILSTFKSTQ